MALQITKDLHGLREHRLSSRYVFHIFLLTVCNAQIRKRNRRKKTGLMKAEIKWTEQDRKTEYDKRWNEKSETKTIKKSEYLPKALQQTSSQQRKQSKLLFKDSRCTSTHWLLFFFSLPHFFFTLVAKLKDEHRKIIQHNYSLRLNLL